MHFFKLVSFVVAFLASRAGLGDTGYNMGRGVVGVVRDVGVVEA